METKKVKDQRRGWTNERHLRYLNSVETSFVRTMLDHHKTTGGQRMDRNLPDSSDSTVDLENDQRRQSASDILDTRGRRSSARQPYTACEDQVVPQVEDKRDDNKDEKDQPAASIIAPDNSN